MSSADFRRIKSVHCLFGRVMQYIVTMRKKREILFNFWLPEKKKKTTYEIDFSNQRKKERKEDTASRKKNYK